MYNTPLVYALNIVLSVLYGVCRMFIHYYSDGIYCAVCSV